ncbi:EF-hand domain-containing protein, partial [Haematococcus lacustris]
VVVFLEALCEEYERCEGILLDVLPAIFKKWDTDQDSFISQGDILPMFEHMVRQGVQCDDVAREAQQFWQLATAVENDGIMPGLAAAAMQSELPSSRNSTRPSGMVSIQ